MSQGLAIPDPQRGRSSTKKPSDWPGEGAHRVEATALALLSFIRRDHKPVSERRRLVERAVSIGAEGVNLFGSGCSGIR